MINLCYFTTAQKAATFFRHAEELIFVRHSSEYKTSDSDRKVNRSIDPDAVTRDRMRLIDPKSDQLGPIHDWYFA